MRDLPLWKNPTNFLLIIMKEYKFSIWNLGFCIHSVRMDGFIPASIVSKIVKLKQFSVVSAMDGCIVNVYQWTVRNLKLGLKNICCSCAATAVSRTMSLTLKSHLRGKLLVIEILFYSQGNSLFSNLPSEFI